MFTKLCGFTAMLATKEAQPMVVFTNPPFDTKGQSIMYVCFVIGVLLVSRSEYRLQYRDTIRTSLPTIHVHPVIVLHVSGFIPVVYTALSIV